MKKILFGLCVSCACAAAGVPRADRLAHVDGDGVMRWTDDGGEVALFGVNYYAPFTVDYMALTNRGLSVSQTMRDDVAHFRRLGITCLRVHTFDRQFSTQDGGFVNNRHIALLDELIDLCARNGIYTVLTPIAWWGGMFAPETTGFSARWSMHEMTTNRAAWRVQARFLEAFANHVNAVTGKRYADDPAILCFELINEPLYPPGHPDAAVTDYINVLADGLRASGTRKPIFYNSWHGRNAAAGRARIDGVTGNTYPGGLAGGRARQASQLPLFVGSTLKPDASIARKARMIYEFDCPDTPGAYAYPALAQMFRHEGVQVAAQFQYDLLPLAANNRHWKTHDLNLVYTPAKALSLALAAEIFRRIPRGCAYGTNGQARAFPPFRLDAARNVAQMVTETDYLYTADPLDPPPAPARLRRIWGVGASSVAASTGNGIYFLDKAADGVWRLQLYPSIFQTGDVYSHDAAATRHVLPAAPRVTLRLPDLGPAFRVRPAGADDTVAATARAGSVMLPPGDYVVENVPAYGAPQRAALARLETPPYCAPTPAADVSAASFASVPRQWRAGYPLAFGGEALGATNVIVTVQTATGDRTCAFPVRLCRTPSAWEFFDVPAVMKLPYRGTRGVRRYATHDETGAPALGLAAEPGAFARADRKGFAILPIPCDAAAFRTLFGAPGPGRAILIRARATQPDTTRIEVVFVGEDRGSWGVNLPLTADWRTIRVPVDTLQPFWKTVRGDGTAPDMGRLERISVGFGDWLYGGKLDRPHGFEISSIKMEY